ncbi:prepilin-type N-terminal cleavage/methylation domain-containing protein [Candidatus Daviesbacteria bacterium]|nr:prepilin-type N-terminal cleavage/methylation domain-containing protein [Candidatus Daviesbacteria bacterium]
MGKTVLNAFTLVELLVVIAIIGLIGAYVLSNYGTFGEDQKLKNAVLDIQSLLRQAQTNATSGVKCQGQGGATWFVEFTSGTELNLMCMYPAGGGLNFISGSLKKLPFSGNISIDTMTSGINSCTFGATNTVTFAPLSGAMIASCGTGIVTITVINNKTSNTKSLKVEQGGRIYAQ